jgi:hypothetical protein
MNRIAASALAVLAMSWTIGCGGEDPTGSAANQNPVANAGQDQSSFDADGDGHEEITLNGSESRDVDGTIVEYTWLEGNSPIARGAERNADFEVGVHEVTLVVTDDRGGSDTDAVTILVKPMSPPDPPPDPRANEPPTAYITMPCDGLQSYEGRGMYFGGTGRDPEDGELSHETFEWSYDGRPIPGCGEWDGWAEAGCGYGGWLESIDLGPHVLTLTVRDSDGAQGWASITMTGVEFQNASFTDDILSFMLMYCENCHGAERSEGGIRLDSYEAIMTGGNDNGPLIVEGDPEGGILIPHILSDHYYVDGYGLHVSQWMGEDILPVWILEGARNTDHPHPPVPGPCN